MRNIRPLQEYQWSLCTSRAKTLHHLLYNKRSTGLPCFYPLTTSCEQVKKGSEEMISISSLPFSYILSTPLFHAQRLAARWYLVPRYKQLATSHQPLATIVYSTNSSSFLSGRGSPITQGSWRTILTSRSADARHSRSSYFILISYISSCPGSFS